MTNIQSTITPLQPKVMQDLSIDNAQTEAVDDDRNQFLELMIAQIENQNPLDPQDGGEFLAQLAQFSMVDGIERLNETNEDLYSSYRSTQALQASNLVGRTVSVPSETIDYQSDPIDIDIELSQTTSQLRLYVSNAAGEQVAVANLGEQVQGDVAYTFTGTDSAGQSLPPGRYQILAAAKTAEGEEQMLTRVGMNVDSVTLKPNAEVEINIAGVGALALDDVRQIR